MLHLDEGERLAGELRFPRIPPEVRDKAEKNAKNRAYTNAIERLDAHRKGRPVYGLRLTLGGAPCTPHYVDGLPGVYYPDRVTPVGGVGEATLDQAQQADAIPGCAVELLRLDPVRIEQAPARAEPDEIQLARACAELLGDDSASAVRRVRRHAVRLAERQRAAAMSWRRRLFP